jgi:hypothetical protein
MRGYNPAKPVSMWNRAIEVNYFTSDRPNLERTEYFGSAKEFAEWLDAFDYKNGDVFGWTGCGATMEAVASFRKESEFVAIPEFITEFNTNAKTEEIIGADQFHQLRRMFQRDPEYTVNRHFCGNAKVYSVMYLGSDGEGPQFLSSYVWHVPFDADSAIR